MERSDSVAALERLAQAFTALMPQATDLMVDRQTQAPPDAVGWPAGRNFRVRVRGQAASGQASAYCRVADGGLELMVTSSQAGEVPFREPAGGDAVPEGTWSIVQVAPGDESVTAGGVVERLRRRVLPR